MTLQEDGDEEESDAGNRENPCHDEQNARPTPFPKRRFVHHTDTRSIQPGAAGDRTDGDYSRAAAPAIPTAFHLQQPAHQLRGSEAWNELTALP
jgi:hypothetical protein